MIEKINGIYTYTSEGFVPLKIGASNIGIKDSYNYFASASVEGALNELGNKVNNIDLSNVTFNDIQGDVPISKLPMTDIKNEIGSNLEVTMVSKLKGKKIICAGDSITAGSFITFTDGTYPTILANKTGAIVSNVAFPGEQFTNATSRIDGANIADPDIITILYGANDAPANVAAGDLSDTSSDTISNRVKNIIDHCNTNYPNAKVVFMTTLPRKGLLPTMENYRTAIINACRAYGAFCCDLHGNSGISLYTEDLIAKWTNGDGCHYLQNGHTRIAEILINYLENIVL